MAPKKPPPRDEDPEQSRRFLDLAAELEAAGDLSPIDAEVSVERTMRGVVRLKEDAAGGKPAAQGVDLKGGPKPT